MSQYDHDKAVASISHQVRQFFDHPAQKGFRVFHGSSNSTRAPQYTLSNTVDISALTHILEIDPEKMTATVEPNVKLGALLDGSLEYSLMPPVMPELPDMSIGGAYSGQAGQSSCFKWGIFDQTVQAIEMILADGSIRTSSRSREPELLEHAAGAFGTLGIVTKLVVTLVPAPKFVELTYHTISSMQDASTKSMEFTQDENVDYIDGIMFASTSGVIMTGKNAPSAPQGQVPQTFTNRGDPWFYMHAQAQHNPSTHRPSQEPPVVYIPLMDYLFRYHRGGFWVGHYAFSYFHVPNNRLTRYLLDNCMRTKAIIHAFHESPTLAGKYVVQDMAVRPEQLADFNEQIDGIFGAMWPRYLCPLKGLQEPRWGLQPRLPEDVVGGGRESVMAIATGLYGGPRKREEFLGENVRMERVLGEMGGVKGLYAQFYGSEEEFWGMWNREYYQGVRKSYGAESLPDVYEKVKWKAPREVRRWRHFDCVDGLIGVTKWIRGSDWMRGGR
ncbi:uncharacterized protein KY384_004001 [Bacidia gigantensis]|uniref:uncharacterized protein n=1 Tax=Bacidia gigantensis TaxID=2732470 RepID=UPI001D0494CD|nr:uncharacterized protein KY384_004001 [Bacidia gigantensis]KAG8531289.1 hypothetical protein KY384_004001 [Bacidia gigantensis]